MVTKLFHHLGVIKIPEDQDNMGLERKHWCVSASPFSFKLAINSLSGGISGSNSV